MTDIKKWLNGSKCEICKKEVSSVGDTCYDSPTHAGPWAFMCKPCWLNHGHHFGQEYDAKTFIKIRDLKGRK